MTYEEELVKLGWEQQEIVKELTILHRRKHLIGLELKKLRKIKKQQELIKKFNEHRKDTSTM